MSPIEEIAEQLEEMYGKPGWGPSLPLLDELVLTILSQNTASVNYTRAFEELRRRFPDWRSVMESPVEAVADAIRPGGLANMKAPRIQEILRHLERERGELSLEFLRAQDPWDAFGYLRRLPGVGPKTAACVLMFGCGLPIFPVDTHIHRIAKRLGLVPDDVSAERTQELMQEMIPPERVYSLHVNLVTHGRRTCKAHATDCDRCILFSCPSRGIHQRAA